MLVTKEYVDYLKRHVDWEVMEYEENPFRGYTIEEAKELLGLLEYPGMETQEVDTSVDVDAESEVLNWAEKAPECSAKVRNQGGCGSCWAFATVGLLGDRCCINKDPKVFLELAPQELVGCVQYGCRGSWPTWALDYVAKVKGVVLEKCLPYKAVTGTCAKACSVSTEKFEHFCPCKEKYTLVKGPEDMIKALKVGPISVAFWVCRSFMNYKNGIYKCECAAHGLGLHAVTMVGYEVADGKCVRFIVRNSWGAGWGNKGFFDIGCTECGIHGNYPNGNVFCEV
jgi:hypothetical protein